MAHIERYNLTKECYAQIHGSMNWSTLVDFTKLPSPTTCEYHQQLGYDNHMGWSVYLCHFHWLLAHEMHILGICVAKT